MIFFAKQDTLLIGYFILQFTSIYTKMVIVKKNQTSIVLNKNQPEREQKYNYLKVAHSFRQMYTRCFFKRAAFFLDECAVRLCAVPRR